MDDERRYGVIQTGLASPATIPCLLHRPFGPDVAHIAPVSEDTLEQIHPEIRWRHTSITLHHVHLFPWQIPAVSFILDRLLRHHSSCMLADGPGLGRTVSVLSAILLWAEYMEDEKEKWPLSHIRTEMELALKDQEKLDRGEDPESDVDWLFEKKLARATVSPAPRHKPVLVVVPSHARGSWIRDIDRFFSHHEDTYEDDLRNGSAIRLYHLTDPSRAGELGDTENSSFIRPTATALQTFLGTLSEDHFMTTRTVILTTFEDWRTLSNAGNIQGSSFSIVVIGHAHMLKYSGSAMTEALYRLNDTRFILTSSTPFMTGLEDFATYLRFLHKTSQNLIYPNPPAATAEYCRRQFLDVRRVWRSVIQDRPEFKLTEPGYSTIHHVLDPENFRTALSTDVNAAALPIAMTCMRRVEGQRLRLHEGNEMTIDVAAEIAKREHGIS